MNNAIEVQGLCKRYGDFSLKNVSFSLPAGYIMGFVGQNGAGKTTTIRLLLNMAEREGGSIKVLGLDNIRDEQAIKQDIAVVLDEIYFAQDWKVSDDIYLQNIVPPGMKQISSPNNQVLVIGRVFVENDSDVTTAHSCRSR